MKEKKQKFRSRIFTIFLLLGISLTAFAQTDPSVVATAPAANALGVDNTAILGLTFSETMNAATFTADNVKISGSYGRPFGFPALGSNTNMAVFDPDRDFFPGEVITTTLTIGVAGSTGNSLESPFTYRFTAGVSPNSPGEFPNGQNTISTLAEDAQSVTVADLDGDGDLDAISASKDRIAWYRNDGNGNFGSQRIITTAVNLAIDAITADLDGDGDLDVLSASRGGINIVWYENDGSGNFGGQKTITAGVNEPSSVTTADLDGDGDLDVLLASSSDSRVAWYENDGSGNFGDQRTISMAGIRATDVTTADLDGDGDLDVVSSTSINSNAPIAWYENDGNGNFGGRRNITTVRAGIQSVTVADLDGDGDLDVLSASLNNSTPIAWYENDGNGNFGDRRIIPGAANSAYRATSADLDGDGDLDVLLTSFADGRIAWNENNGGGNFGAQRTITTAAAGALDVTVADLDGDGDLDVISASRFDNRIAWYENAVPSSLTVTATDPTANALGVDNAVGIGLTFTEAVDAATLTTDNVKISGSYGRPFDFPTLGANTNMAVFDPDRDFFPGEVITTTLTTGVASSAGNPLASPFTYRFTAGVSPNSPGEFPNGQDTIFEGTTSSPDNDVTVADLDGDGDLDVLAAHETNSGGSWYENNGSGNFGVPRPITSDKGSFRGLIPADLDGDGDLDVLAITSDDRSIDFFLNNGNENFTEGIGLDANPTRFEDLTVGDLDGDGDLDVLATSFNKIVWYPNEGLTLSGAQRIPAIFGTERIINGFLTGPSRVAVADLDGDGDLDVLSAVSSIGFIAWYPNDGFGSFGAQRTISLAATGAEEVITADLNGNGYLDVICIFAGDNRIVWYPNFNGRFASQQTITTAVDGIRDVTVADLDGDGDLDVLSASFDDNKVAWYPNDGNGNFDDQRIITTEARGALGVAAGDLDGDGDLDVLSARSDKGIIAWYENTGSTPLTANCTAPFTLQLDADGTASITVDEIDNGSQGATGMDIDITDFDCSHLGENTVTLTVTNALGDTETCTTTVTVESSIASATPDMASLPEVRGECGATVTEVPTATADCGGTVTATTNDPLEYNEQGTFIVTWTYDIGNGNTSTQRQTVIVEDAMAPVADRATLPDIIGGCGATVTEAPTATDNCAGTVTATTNDPLSYPEQGTYTITWTYGDGNGNTSTQVQNVVVENSITSATPDIAILPEVRGECSATVTTVPTATDNCGGTVTATTNDPLTYTEQGTFIITWTYGTGNGNTSTQTQTVIVEDLVPPMAIAQDVTVELDENGQAAIAAEDVDNGSTDNCGIADLALDMSIFDCPELGDTVVELTVTDVSGNSSSATATVTFTAPDNNSDGVADTCGSEVSIIPGPAVSPNGDNINDTWVIENITDFPDALVKVFDRNGREVLSTDNYRNDWGGTEGTGGNLLPVGSYYYIVHLRQPTARNVTGWLYLNY
ncbi:FG-GAP-like repeat-containing protein [Ulvibacterium sp.]|uniref:FG-GAP-like repeat-containing protein n=1 Tax=Ulvibacterium sp. TaxID=2665914 RepID=UPI003BAD0E39